LSLLFISISPKATPRFQQTFVKLDVYFDPDDLQQDSGHGRLSRTGQKIPANMFPDVRGRRDKRMLYGLVSSGAAFQLRNLVLKDPDVIGRPCRSGCRPTTTWTC
jgi:phosphate transport system permease protein